MDRTDVDLRNPASGSRPTPGASVFADPDQVQIQGVVVGVMRKY